MIYRVIPGDVRRTMLSVFMPASLSGHIVDLAGYFDKQYDKTVSFFRDMVKRYAHFWLHETQAGVKWREHLEQRVDETNLPSTGATCAPATPQDLLDFNGFPGIQFTKVHLIHIYARMLGFLDTEEIDDPAEDHRVGWLAMDPEDIWRTRLTTVALDCILFIVLHEGPSPGNLKTHAITHKMQLTNFAGPTSMPPDLDLPQVDATINPMEVFNNNARVPYPSGSDIVVDTVHTYDLFTLKKKHHVYVAIDCKDLDQSPGDNADDNDHDMPDAKTWIDNNVSQFGDGSAEKPYTHVLLPGDYTNETPGFSFHEDFEQEDQILNKNPEFEHVAREADKRFHVEATTRVSARLRSIGADLITMPISCDPPIPTGVPPSSFKFATLMGQLGPFGQLSLACSMAAHATARIQEQIAILKEEEANLRDKVAELTVHGRSLEETYAKHQEHLERVEALKKDMGLQRQKNAQLTEKVEATKEGRFDYKFGSSQAPSINTGTADLVKQHAHGFGRQRNTAATASKNAPRAMYGSLNQSPTIESSQNLHSLSQPQQPLQPQQRTPSHSQQQPQQRTPSHSQQQPQQPKQSRQSLYGFAPFGASQNTPTPTRHGSLTINPDALRHSSLPATLPQAAHSPLNSQASQINDNLMLSQEPASNPDAVENYVPPSNPQGSGHNNYVHDTGSSSDVEPRDYVGETRSRTN